MKKDNKITPDSDGRQKSIPTTRFGIRGKIDILVITLIVFIFVVTMELASGLHMSLEVTANIQGNDMLGRLAEEILDTDDMTYLLTRGLEIYESVPEEIRQKRTSEEYLSYFDELETPEYLAIRNELAQISDDNGYKWIDLRVIDPYTDRFIFLMDTNPETDSRFETGYWEAPEEGIMTYIVGFGDGEEASDDLGPDAGGSLGYRLRSTIDNIVALRSLQNEPFATLVPLYHPVTGEEIGYIGLGEDMADYYEHRLEYRIIFISVMFIILIICLLITQLVAHYALIKPITRLSHAARNYVSDKDKYQTGHYFENVMIPTHDEVKLLRDSMSIMEEDINNYVTDITDMTAERERVEAELNVGSQIQLSMLPDKLTGYRGGGNFDIKASMRAAKEVGGDLYDFFVLDDDHIAIAIADVSGKGVPAALFMVIIKVLINVAGQSEQSPAAILNRINNQICANNPETMFVTVWLSVYSIRERALTYVNAGHEYPALYRASDDEFRLIVEEHDPVVGFIPDIEYRERTITFEPGDKLYLYTDGIPEATAEDETMYGTKRMLECLNEHRAWHGHELLDAVVESVDKYVGDAKQFDDMTSVIFEIVDDHEQN